MTAPRGPADRRHGRATPGPYDGGGAALVFGFLAALWVLIVFAGEGEVFALWGPVAGLLGRFVVGYAIGRYPVGFLLPRYLLHGATRPALSRQAPFVATPLAAGGAVVVGAGWMVGRALLRVAGWPCTLSAEIGESFAVYLDRVAGGGLFSFMGLACTCRCPGPPPVVAHAIGCQLAWALGARAPMRVHAA